MLLRRSQASRYSIIRARVLVDRRSATQEHPPDHAGQCPHADQHRPGLNQHRGEWKKAALADNLRGTRQHFGREDAESDQRAGGSRGDTDRRMDVVQFHWRLPFHSRVTSDKAGDDGRLQRSAEPSIVLVQGGDVGSDSCYHRPACDPPSTWSTSPVTWPACARNSTAPTTSLTLAIFPIGCKVLRNSFGSSVCIGVSTIPGATALNLIPSFAYSMAKLLITAFSPPLVIIGTAAFTPAIG